MLRTAIRRCNMKLQTVRNKLRWDNVLLRELPGDFGGANVPRQVRSALYCGGLLPTAPAEPHDGLRLCALSQRAARLAASYALRREGHWPPLLACHSVIPGCLAIALSLASYTLRLRGRWETGEPGRLDQSI